MFDRKITSKEITSKSAVATATAIRGVLLVAALSISAGVPVSLASGSGGAGAAGSSAPVDSRPDSPEQEAEATYKKGLKHKGRAWKAEKKGLAASSDKKREKQQRRAAKEYKKAQDQFVEVLQILPEHYKAANELGYVLRKQGKYERAIGAYNHALVVYPDFLQAIEYRGEAFIAVGFYTEAKQAYMRLFRDDTELAEQLMVRMREWSAEQSDPGAKARDFVEWIEERQNVSAFGELTESASPGW